MDSDHFLVEKTIAGDLHAYELLVIKYQQRVHRLIRRMVHDSDLVQDLVQETFIRAYRAIHQFRGDAQFYTWLYRIAINTAKKHLLESRRDPVIPEHASKKSSENDETSSSLVESITQETPETLLEAKELAHAVNAAVQGLTEDLRQALILREIEGLTYEEIALLMDCPIGTVRSRIFRARETIAAKIKPLLANQSMTKRW